MIRSADGHITIDGNCQVTKHGIALGHIAYVTDAEVRALWERWLAE